jgi:cytochrome c551/c552
MPFAKIVKSGLVSAVICAVALFFLTVAMSSLTVSSAQATPAIAKGKPCGTCHEGSPPSKSNLKKKKK